MSLPEQPKKLEEMSIKDIRREFILARKHPEPIERCPLSDEAKSEHCKEGICGYWLECKNR